MNLTPVTQQSSLSLAPRAALQTQERTREVRLSETIISAPGLLFLDFSAHNSSPLLE